VLDDMTKEVVIAIDISIEVVNIVIEVVDISILVAIQRASRLTIPLQFDMCNRPATSSNNSNNSYWSSICTVSICTTLLLLVTNEVVKGQDT